MKTSSRSGDHQIIESVYPAKPSNTKFSVALPSLTCRMALSDDDVFALSDDDEIMQDVPARNPVEEHLLKQRQEVLERVENAKSNVEDVKRLAERVLRKMHVKATCGQSSDSDTENDLYQVTGEPVIKRKRNRSSIASQPLETTEVWQKVIDDKWIVGVVLKNTSNRTLEDPCLYVSVKNEREIRGVASFWEGMEESLWTRTEELDPDSAKLVATCVLDLPSFENNAFFDAYGTVAYVLNGKPYQTVVPTFRLNANEAIDRSLAPRFNADVENSVLAIKAISVERTLAISFEKDTGRGVRLLAFLEDMDFKEIVSDVYVSKNQESFRHCIFEILPCMESEATVRISARYLGNRTSDVCAIFSSQSRLNIIIFMLRDEFPDMNVPDPEDRLIEAVIALERELKLELAGVDDGGIHMARITTDLLIP